MAQIVLASRTENMFELYVSGLDPDYDQTIRTANWYVIHDGTVIGRQAVEIGNGITEGGRVQFRGLSPGYTYSVLSIITNIAGSDPVVLSATYRTIQPGTIEYFDVVQNSYGGHTATCTWESHSYAAGSTYTITVEGYEKASGTVRTDNSVQITLDSFKKYTALLTVNSGGIITQAECEFYMYAADPSVRTIVDLGSAMVTNDRYEKGFVVTDPRYIYRLAVTFERSGKALFFSNYNVHEYDFDPYGYLSTSDQWNTSARKPYNTVAKDDDSREYNMNFLIEFNVVAGVTYYLWVEQNSTLETGELALYVVPPQNAGISKWDWQQSNGTASAQQTQNAYSAILGNGYTTSFSYLVWNDMVEKVKEILDYMDEAWETYGSADYPSTKMTASDKMLTATRFNSLRFNIGSHKSTGITDKVRGNDVIGNYFITLTNCINAWIDDL